MCTSSSHFHPQFSASCLEVSRSSTVVHVKFPFFIEKSALSAWLLIRKRHDVPQSSMFSAHFAKSCLQVRTQCQTRQCKSCLNVASLACVDGQCLAMPAHIRFCNSRLPFNLYLDIMLGRLEIYGTWPCGLPLYLAGRVGMLALALHALSCGNFSQQVVAIIFQCILASGWHAASITQCRFLTTLLCTLLLPTCLHVCTRIAVTVLFYVSPAFPPPGTSTDLDTSDYEFALHGDCRSRVGRERLCNIARKLGVSQKAAGRKKNMDTLLADVQASILRKQAEISSTTDVSRSVASSGAASSTAQPNAPHVQAECPVAHVHKAANPKRCKQIDLTEVF